VLNILKYGLAAFGAFLWITLWYERSPWLGLLQGIILIVLLSRELRRKRRDDPLRGTRNPPGTVGR